jgi:hypothetical protein
MKLNLKGELLESKLILKLLLANDYFKLNEIQQLEIVIDDDAFEFVLRKREI